MERAGELPQAVWKEHCSSKGEKRRNSVPGSLTCSGRSPAQSMISWGLSTGIRDAYPRAESNFNSRTFHEAKYKATVIC